MAFGIFLVTVITLLEITKGSSSIPIPSSRYSHPFKYFDNAKGDDANNADDTYLNWYSSVGSISYVRSIYLPSPQPDTSQGIALHWSIKDDTIEIVLVTQATGWIGFGIAEAGGMPGADIMIYEASMNKVIDAYATSYSAPIADDSQDWTLINSTVAGGYIIVEAQRLLDTGDSQDRPIVNDGDAVMQPHRIIAAWGDDAHVAYHGSKRVSGAVRFFEGTSNDFVMTAGLDSDVFYQQMSNEAEGYVDVTIQNFPVPKRTTTYISACLTLSDLLEQGLPPDLPLQIIGFDPLVDTHMPHHMVLHGSPVDIGDDVARTGCKSMIEQSSLQGWAVGSGPTLLPQDVGLPFGASDRGFISFRLSIHYDNRSHEPNVTDSSGFRFYYTSQLREHSLALLLLGDPGLKLRGSPAASAGLAMHHFACPSTCTETSFSNSTTQEITVISELLYMHETGARMNNRLIRNGSVIHEGSIDYWDVRASGLFPVQKGTFTVRPGDSFETECYYDESKTTRTLGDGQHVEFGSGSQDEMCIAFLFYYPRIDGFSGKCGHGIVGSCHADHNVTDLIELEDVGRRFGVAGADVGVVSEGADVGAVADSTSSEKTLFLHWPLLSTNLLFASLLLS